MRQHDEYRPRSLAPSRSSLERPCAAQPTRASVITAVSAQARAQARTAASPINGGLKR